MSTNTLFIAEKPSLAQAIAEAWAEKQGLKAAKSGGAWRIGNDAVVALCGHMYELAEPAAYNPAWAKRSLDLLPIKVPEDGWKLVVSPDKADAIKVVNALIKDSKNLVNCGDAAREGQLLVDEVIKEAGTDPFGANVRRLWCRSVTRKDLLAAMADMRPNNERRTLSAAAESRQRSDWKLGMNFSRLYTALARRGGSDGNITVGRVQTPTLRLVVDRDLERSAFKPIDHFVPTLECGHHPTYKATWIAPEDAEGLDSEGRLVDKVASKRICTDAIAHQIGQVAAYKSEPKSKSAPLPYSLSALQAEAGAKLGLSAKETLDTAQKLYEEYHATTYPRSDCRYLPTSIGDDVAAIMRGLATGELADAVKSADPGIRGQVFDDKQISDHHAIIPTTEFDSSKFARMNETEKAVFLLIARAFVAQFYPPYKYRSLIAEIAVGNDRFRATGKTVEDNGWRKVYGAADVDEDETEAAQSLPPLKVGDAVAITNATPVAARTKPPAAFTDGTLITAMCQIHKYVADAEAKRKLREGDGIGTEATRADCIETLLKRGYLARKGKNGLESTPFGKSIISELPEDVKSPVLTALWERDLTAIVDGKLTGSEYQARLDREITERVDSSRHGSITVVGAPPRPDAPPPLPGDGDRCPKCGKGVMKTKKVTTKDKREVAVLSCSYYPDCQHSIWPNSGGGGSKSNSDIPPIEGHGKPCPKCGKGAMLTKEITSKKDGRKHIVLSCNAYPACDHMEFQKTAASPTPAHLPPLPGHGKPCGKCGGKMLTKQITKKDGSTVIVLACDSYKKNGCSNTEWPKR